MQASPATWRLRTTTLVGDHVILEPLDETHIDAIALAGSEGRDTFGLTLVPDGRTQTADYVHALLRDADAGLVAPFVQRRADGGVIVGCTRFMDPHWRLGRADPDEVEVGGTWLTGPAQRTGINTNAKLLLLTYAFETWQVQRVAIATDERNIKSRAAIERLGATFEGVLRRHRVAYDTPGVLRNTALYSIVESEWPEIRAGLVAHLGAH